jgi:flavin-dependent dehydrogenase
MIKNILVAALSLFFSLEILAQEKTIELNCYNKWAAKFEDRGAEEVKDGTYDDVIVTNRQGARAVCNNGKAIIKDGKITAFYILLSDGSYEEVKKTWKNKSNENVNVINGISKSMLTVHGELINVLWPNKIRPKKAKPTTAPEPSDD